MTQRQSGSDSLSTTEVRVFSDSAPDTIKFPVIFFFVGLVVYYSQLLIVLRSHLFPFFRIWKMGSSYCQ